MKLSTKTRYGLRILLQIAIDMKEDKAIKGKSIAKKQDISEPYMEQIMIPLKEAGIVDALRGRYGGYRIIIPFKEITIRRIIELFEGEINLVKCEDNSGHCMRIAECQVTNVWSDLSNMIKKETDKVNIETLLKQVEQGINMEYVI